MEQILSEPATRLHQLTSTLQEQTDMQNHRLHELIFIDEMGNASVAFICPMGNVVK